jgi:outer membrane protein
MKAEWMAALALPALLLAQQPGPGGENLPLSLKKALEIAQAPQGAVRLQLAREAIEQAKAQRAQARGALLPNVDGLWTYQSFTRNLEAFGVSITPPPGIPISIPTFVGPIETSDWRATAGWSLLDWSAWQRYKASKSRLEAATADEKAARNLVEAGVIRAYTAAQRAEQMVKTAEANVALAQRVLRLAQSQKEAGTGTGIDITRAGVQLAQEKQRLIQAQEARDRARLELLRVLNLSLSVEVEATDPLDAQPAEVPEAAEALARAEKNRPELLAQAARERAAKLNYSAVKAERYPSAQAFGDYGTIGTTLGSGLPTRVVGVRVNLPIFDGGRRDARRVEALSFERQEAIRSHDVRQQVELEVREAINALRSASSQVQVAREALELAEKELEQAQRRYEAGVAPSLEVTDAQTRVSRARETQVNAIYQQRATRADLGVATGDLSDLLN